jgi:hypothetical protein
MEDVCNNMKTAINPAFVCEERTDSSRRRDSREGFLPNGTSTLAQDRDDIGHFTQGDHLSH